MKKQLITAISHSLVWICFFLIVPLMPMRPGESINLYTMVPFFCAYAYLIVFFYINTHVLLPRLIEKKKYLFYALYILFIFLIYFFIQRLIWHNFNPIMNGPPPPHEMFEGKRFSERNNLLPWRQISLSFFQFFLFFILSIGYKIALSWISINQRNREIEAEMLKSELSYLKAQINPHFFFNTLNTIYALTLSKSEKASEATLLLSQIVRYVLDKSKEDFVSLQEEVLYLEDYINLQKLRFSTALNVNFNIVGDPDKYNIAPLIMIPFIENAFQYGVSTHYTSEIDILIEAKEDKVYFKVNNHIYKSDNNVFDRNSIGIENTRKRLDLIYPGNYSLVINNQNDSFQVELFINSQDKQ